MMKRMFFIVLCVASSYIVCSADSMVRKEDRMCRIYSFEDVKPFIGTVVAYQAVQGYFKAAQGHPINKERLDYGYIEPILSIYDCCQQGYSMVRLVRQKHIPCECLLVNSNLSADQLFMRLATAEEKETIRSAINKNVACFEYIDDKSTALRILEG